MVNRNYCLERNLQIMIRNNVPKCKTSFATYSRSSNTFFRRANYVIVTEAYLNSRPLCPLPDDPEDQRDLSPGYFLIGGKLMTVSEMSLENVKSNRFSRWKLWQQIFETF